MPTRSALRQQFMQTDTSTPMDQATLMREAMKAQVQPGMARGAPERLGPIKRMINEAIVGKIVDPLVRRAEAARQRRKAAGINMTHQMSAAVDRTAQAKRDILRTQSDEERYNKANLGLAVSKMATDFYTQYRATADPTDPIQKEIDELLKEDEEFGEDLLSFGDERYGETGRPGEGFIVNPREAEIMDQRKMLADLYERYGLQLQGNPAAIGAY